MHGFAQNKNTALLVIGDLIAYFFSLILTLGIRYGEIPTRSLVTAHTASFLILIPLFIIACFSAGLYDKRTALFRGNATGLIWRVQIVNALIGVIFFYFAPVAIAPKANLFIYFIVSTALLFLWRTIMYPVVSTSRRQPAILIGIGDDINDLHAEINSGRRYGVVFRELIAPQASAGATAAAIADAVARTDAALIVADLRNPTVEAAMPFLYTLIFGGVQIIDASRYYAEVFDRIPLSLVGERWLVENFSTSLGSRRTYDALKRLTDIAVSVIGGIASLVFYPFVYIAIKLDDGGDIFISQDRVGDRGKMIRILKFRTMSGNDQGKYGASGVTTNVVTRSGTFLRRSRIDELPQFCNVLRGDLSMVGPRPELPHLVNIYEKEIPYYNARHLVKPGLFGWAQIYHEAHPHHSVATEETRNKLSYDLFYIKNRSIVLDLKIVFRTFQILLKRSGR